MKQFLLFLFLITSCLTLHASKINLDKSKHTDENTIVSLSPTPAQTNVYPDTDINIVFNVDLDEKHIKFIKHNIIVVRQLSSKGMMKFHKKNKVAGMVSYISDEKRLRFTPAKLLKPGTYEVDVIAIKSTKRGLKNIIKNMSYRFSVRNIHPVSLKIIPTPVEIKKGSTLDLKTAVVYDDGSEQIIKENIVYKSTNPSIFNIETNASASGVKEGETTFTASYKSLTSEATQAIVYLDINGHRLPPEPDPIINNSTLFGVDVNNNGVRDDVERWIYFKYQNEHPIQIDIAMQAGKAWQKVLEDPTKAKEIYSIIDAASSCEAYYAICIDANSELLISNGIINKFFIEHLVFNTSDRTTAFLKYDKLLSGATYPIPRCAKKKVLCDFNTTQYEK